MCGCDRQRLGRSFRAGLPLREASVDLAGAEAIVGTSAGALVGALLASGLEVTEALTSLAALGQSIDPHSLAAGDGAFLSAMRQASRETGSDRAEARRRNHDERGTVGYRHA